MATLPQYRLAQLQLALQRVCRYLVAIAMHTGSMTVAQAAAFFRVNAYMTPNNAMVEALRGTQDPGYLRYQLGQVHDSEAARGRSAQAGGRI